MAKKRYTYLIVFTFTTLASTAILGVIFVGTKIQRRVPLEESLSEMPRELEKRAPEPSLPPKVEETEKDDKEPQVVLKEIGEEKILSPPKQVYQTFNNCGPATVSMILSYYGISKSQQEIGEQLRPYQNPRGDNDDKTIFPQEFADYIKGLELLSYYRVAGDLELLKLFISNDFPVVVKQWLHKGEDIGHFRIVRGYKESEKFLITDDSYDGPNRKISDEDFLNLWQPFNYAYIVVAPEDKREVVEAILAERTNSDFAYNRAVEISLKELEEDPNSIYPLFNLSTSYYHLRDYQKSAEYFEKVEGKLPRRMMWYQIEPILAYKELKNYERVFELTTKILTTGNLAFSELYQIRGEIHLEQGEIGEAWGQFERALRYNENYLPAKEALESL